MECLKSLSANHLTGADLYHDPATGILNGLFTTRTIVRILWDQLPWWRFAVSECFRLLNLTLCNAFVYVSIDLSVCLCVSVIIRSFVHSLVRSFVQKDL